VGNERKAWKNDDPNRRLVAYDWFKFRKFWTEFVNDLLVKLLVFFEQMRRFHLKFDDFLVQHFHLDLSKVMVEQNVW